MKTEKRFKQLLIAQIILLVTILLIGAWWGTLLSDQSEQIAHLQHKLGISEQQTVSENLRIKKMILWESVTFFVLLVVTSGVMLWFYWRDILRTRKQQAFFASVTHELKTPLTSIRLQAESLSEQSNSETAPLIHRMLEDTARLESQVNRTLELARIEGGGLIFLESFPIKPHLENILEYWKETLSEKVDVEFHVDEDWVLADKNALQIIFKNLLENSIKYSNQEKLRIEIHSRKNKTGQVELFYKDNGTSFSGKKESLGTLFYTGPKSRGTGVGLYLIQNLMKKMRGLVQFSPKNDGFSVKLLFQGGPPHE